MKNYKYEDLVNVIIDDDNNISMLQVNTNTVNEVSSQISLKVVESLKQNRNNYINIYMGTLFGITLLSGSGPSVNAKIANVATVDTDLKSEFYSTGINQTIHKVFLEISTNVSILTPYHSLDSNIKSKVLLAESIIVGNIPNTYYYLKTSKDIDPSELLNN